MAFFGKLSESMKKTRDGVAGRIDSLLKGYTFFGEELFEELEEILIMSDMGGAASAEIIEELRKQVRAGKTKTPGEVRELLISIITELLGGDGETGLVLTTRPSIILVIGVNGVGKTTTIAKLAAMLGAGGKKVILGAADTFRAAAIDQLAVWADRAGAELIRHQEGADPAAVVFDTIAAAKSRKADVVICDTAGRLHNKKNLMDELGKIFRVIERELPGADREVLLVLDATTGQNAVSQAAEFGKAAAVSGIVLTKLDGTARGGIVVAVRKELGIPVKFIGVGEKMEDLRPFDAREFAEAILK